MGALTIAFDITIVGALALPWVLIIIHVFFLEGETGLQSILRWVTFKKAQAAAGVLLFALTYTLGSAVSRTARDFFNDDDLRIQVGSRLFRVGATEDHIVARVLCDMKDSDLLPAEAEDPVIVKKIAAFKIEASADSCQSLLRWSERHTHNDTDEHLEEASRNLFGLIENTLLLKGEDATLRLRQLHDQIMVLRGAAFNGFIGFSLCLFAWVGARRNEKQPSWLRLALAFIPVVYFAVALRAICNHYSEPSPSDPPYMEFTFFLLVLAAVWLIWLPRKKVQPPKVNETSTPETAAKQEKKKKKDYWQVEHCPRLIVVSAFLTIATFFGWWSTELAYAQRVVYTYESQSKAAVSPQK